MNSAGSSKRAGKTATGVDAGTLSVGLSKSEAVVTAAPSLAFTPV